MKTNISEFCTEFSEVLFPLAESLGDAVHMLEDVGEESLAPLTMTFSNVRHRLEALVNKVQGQEAYVLLFGPLKSGKSTLLNAISAGYVSEVTSLPAYPCMVNMKYGEEPKYSVIRYSGRKDQVDTPDELKKLLEQSHRTLSERVRAIEDFGEEFDPIVHLPSAIRRVQVELPVENLRESGTVLVDTPGLYSKMKFGYDAMTQDFRDSAACAVFVVKTDNLFLEQVFDDFNDLLDQFSRVFVVVNIDSGKQDLCPDGTLTPSMESIDPDQIVKAFESLTMSAPLRRAAEGGRLHLYPIDLCSAAARRLRNGGRPADEAEDGEPDRFDVFLKDLLDYLNSTDYLLEFMADSIRQSQKLTEEIVGACESEPAEAIRRGQADVHRRMETLEQTRASASRAVDVDWAARFSELRSAQRQAREKSRSELRDQLAERAAQAVDAWYAGDGSLAALREQELLPRISEAAASYRERVRKQLESVAASPRMGLSLPDEIEADIRAIEIDLDEVGARVLKELPAAGEEKVPVQLSLDRIPIRRRLWDKLLFRSPSSLRRKLFGPPESQDRPVPPGAKSRILGPEARESMLKLVETACDRLFDQAERQHGEGPMRAFTDGCVKAVASQLTGKERQLARDMKEAEATAEKLGRLESTFRQLGEVAGDVQTSVGEMEEVHRPQVQNLAETEVRDVFEPVGEIAPPLNGQEPGMDQVDEEGDEAEEGAEQEEEAAVARGDRGD